MTKTIMEKVAEAKQAVPDISAADANAMRKRDNVLIVDVRDPTEVAASGKVAGAVNVSRGMLEFKADPASPYHDERFQPDKTVILYCASGGRSALSAKALQDLGYGDVHNLGAFKTWAEAGFPVEREE